MKIRSVVALLAAIALVDTVATTAAADTQTTNNAPYSCTTSPNLGNQAATLSVTASDTVDPATPGDAETYRFVVPFSQAQPPVTAMYQGGTTSWRIPAGFSVTSVSMQDPPGGSPISSTAAVQGDSIIVTSTANVPLNGTTYPTPDLIVNGTVQSSAAGKGITWLLPYQLVAIVNVQGFGNVTATCTPDAPNTVIAQTTVPLGPQPPVAANQNVALAQGTNKAITLTATDPDTPQNQLVFAIATQPAHGTVTGTPPMVTYTPASTYVGTDSFTFTVTDPQGGKSTGTVSINVYPSTVIDNTPPTISLTEPKNGAVYTPSQAVNAVFSCADATTGIKSCTGTVANGAPINVTDGVHTFTVNAMDNANNPARTTVSYRIVETALVTSAATSIPIDCGSLLPTAPTSIPVAASAPSQVGTGRSMKFRVAFGAQSVPALTTATNIKYVFNAPASGTVSAASIESGTGTPNARTGAAVSAASGVVTLTVPGPIAGGTTSATSFTPPAFDVTITAASTAGSVVQTQFARLTEHIVLGVVAQDLSCPGGNAGQNQPNPILTRTTIIDTTPPVALISKPGNGDVILQGATVNANYACADDHSLATCTGTVASGAAIDTATTGIKSFVAQAADAAGNTAATFVSYTVVAPTQTFTARFPSAAGTLLDATAAYYNTTRANLPRVAVAAFAYADAVNPALAHAVAVPPNTGSIVIGTTYPRDQVPAILDLAAKWGMDADSFHVMATDVLCYIYAVRHP